MEKISDTIPLSATMLMTLSLFTALIVGETTGVAVPQVSLPNPVRAPVAERATAAAVTFVVAQDGNIARYRVQEQLIGFNLPSLAIGETRAVSGAISLDSAGKVIRGASRISIDVRNLRSDSDRRDGYVRGRILETDRYPTVEFAPVAIEGLEYPLPSSGSRTLKLVGDLTVHGVTRATMWQVKASFERDRISGIASTSFTFGDFGLTQPRVPVVLSVDDTIGLHYNFMLLHDAP